MKKADDWSGVKHQSQSKIALLLSWADLLPHLSVLSQVGMSKISQFSENTLIFVLQEIWKDHHQMKIANRKPTTRALIYLFGLSSHTRVFRWWPTGAQPEARVSCPRVARFLSGEAHTGAGTPRVCAFSCPKLGLFNRIRTDFGVEWSCAICCRPCNEYVWRAFSMLFDSPMGIGASHGNLTKLLMDDSEYFMKRI